MNPESEEFKKILADKQSAIDLKAQEIKNLRAQLKQFLKDNECDNKTHYQKYKDTYNTYYEKNKEKILAKYHATKPKKVKLTPLGPDSHSELPSSSLMDPVVTETNPPDSTPTLNPPPSFEAEKVLDFANTVLNITPQPCDSITNSLSNSG